MRERGTVQSWHLQGRGCVGNMCTGVSNAHLPMALALCGLCGFLLLMLFLGQATNASLLGILIFVEIVVGAMWGYRERFFPFLAIVFFFAGTGIPPLAFWSVARWFVLGAGAAAGVATYLKGPCHKFGKFHLVALFCVIAAVVSASASSYPKDSLLKVVSLVLLFVYAACGVRVAAIGREQKFFAGLLTFSEALTYLTAVCYFILHYAAFGNPNSLGAVMGVLVVPLLLWGVLMAEGVPAHGRHLLALALAVSLLVASHARAGMLAAAVSCALVCMALHRYRMLLLLAGTGLLIAVSLVFGSAPISDQPRSLASAFIYKGHPEHGVLSSRKSPWEQTISSVREHAWLGTGFGTSATKMDVSETSSAFSSAAPYTREHGNSYLAILEWVGVVGVGPFVALLGMIVVNAAKSLVRMRQCRSPLSPLVPAVGVVVAGLVHAAFEDWLFATGYFLCVFFWGLAFVLVDLVAVAEPTASRSWVAAAD